MEITNCLSHWFVNAMNMSMSFFFTRLQALSNCDNLSLRFLIMFTKNFSLFDMLSFFNKDAWIDRSRSFSFSVASNCSAIATSYHWVKLRIRSYVQMSDHRRAHDLRFLTIPNVRSPTSARSPISDESICPITDEHTISDFRRAQSSDHRRVHNSRFPTTPKSDHRRALDEHTISNFRLVYVSDLRGRQGLWFSTSIKIRSQASMRFPIADEFDILEIFPPGIYACINHSPRYMVLLLSPIKFDQQLCWVPHMVPCDRVWRSFRVDVYVYFVWRWYVFQDW